MALLNNTQREYYQGSDHGNYQFTSLKDIINQFMVVYVGEGKAISKASRIDVSAKYSFLSLKILGMT